MTFGALGELLDWGMSTIAHCNTCSTYTMLGSCVVVMCVAMRQCTYTVVECGEIEGSHPCMMHSESVLGSVT